MARAALILFIIGTLVSAQQAHSGDIIDCGERELELAPLAGTAPVFAATDGVRALSAAADTLETFDIELEEEKKGNIYKEIAAFVIIAAMVAYMVVQLIGPGDEETEPEPTGKDVPGPFVQISLPLTP